MNNAASTVMAILFTFAPHATAAGNLLVNPGFEAGDFSGWTVGGNSVQIGVARDGTPIPNVDPEFVPAFQNVRSGGFAGNALVTDVHAPTHLITLTQVVAVNPDQDIDVGFWMGNDSHHDLGISIDPNHTQIFIDDAGLLASGSRNIGAGSGPGDFVELHRVFNSGSRTNIMVTYEINGSGTAPAAVSFDDFFFTPVPEPATLLALGMGLSIISFARYRAGAGSGHLEHTQRSRRLVSLLLGVLTTKAIVRTGLLGGAS